MGALTEYLQDSSAEFCPPGWTCRREVSVLDGAMAELFGYMTIELYASLDESEPRFDGNRAWRHLNEHLAMNLIPVTEDPELSAFFDEWSRRVAVSL